MKLQSIADAVGMSRATVSRALRDDPRVAQKTKQIIKDTAKTMGYQKNPYISVLMSEVSRSSQPKISPVIAFISNYTDTIWLAHQSLLAARKAADERAREYGFQIEPFIIDRNEPAKDFIRVKRILEARGIHAVILASFGENTIFDAIDLKNNPFAAVTLGMQLEAPPLPSITSDFLWNTKMILKSMRERGYRRIGMAIRRDLLERMQMLPRMAFLDFEFSIPEDDRAGIWIGDEKGISEFAHWLYEKKPDAIITADSYPQTWLYSLGYQIPQDLGVTQLQPNFIPFPSSGIDHWFADLGGLAIEVLMIQIQKNQMSIPEQSIHIHHRGKWIPGYSLESSFVIGEKDPHRSIKKALAELASYEIKNHLPARRQKLLDQIYNSPFPGEDQSGDSSRYQPLSLKSVANAAMHSPHFPPQVPDISELPLEHGLQFIHGIPFHVPPVNPLTVNTIICLNPKFKSKRIRPRRKSKTLSIPVSGTIDSLFFLHQAYFVINADTVATYRIKYDNGEWAENNIIPYFPPEGSKDKAAVQDSFPSFPQFENERAKPYLAVSNQVPYVRDKFFYVFKLVNPHPHRSLKAIEIMDNPDSQTTLLIIGITLKKKI